MKLKYLGSGGGGGIPELFCSCPVCKNAREKQGKDLCRRSLAMVDDNLVIDLPCDARDSFVAHDVDPTKVAHILITHAHYDHFLAENLLTRPCGAKQADLYISHGSGKKFSQRCEDIAKLPTPAALMPFNVPKVHLKHAFERFEVGRYTVTTLDSSHARNLETLNYIIQRESKSILWLHDSGFLTEASRQWLSNKKPYFLLVSMDCALPMGAKASDEHMDLNACVETAKFLQNAGCADEKTQFILSHISHNTKMSHEELFMAAKNFGFRPAFDGETIYI